MLAGASDSLDNGATKIPCASRDGNNTHLVQNTFTAGAKGCKLSLDSKPDELIDVYGMVGPLQLILGGFSKEEKSSHRYLLDISWASAPIGYPRRLVVLPVWKQR